MHRKTVNATAALPLPDGRRADQMRVAELYRELTKIGIPGINTAHGKQELLHAYEGALLSRIEAGRRAGHTQISPGFEAFAEAAKELAA